MIKTADSVINLPIGSKCLILFLEEILLMGLVNLLSISIYVLSDSKIKT